jgi:hypothetical protein
MARDKEVKPQPEAEALSLLRIARSRAESYHQHRHGDSCWVTGLLSQLSEMPPRRASPGIGRIC